MLLLLFKYFEFKYMKWFISSVLVTCHWKFHVFHKKAILVGDVINQGRKIYNGRHACLTKENNSFITKCDGIITHCDSLVYYEVRWTVITNCDSFFITKCPRFIANCDRYYKVRWLLQTATVHGRVFFNVIAIFPNNSTTRWPVYPPPLPPGFWKKISCKQHKCNRKKILALL